MNLFNLLLKDNNNLEFIRNCSYSKFGVFQQLLKFKTNIILHIFKLDATNGQNWILEWF